MIFFFKIVSLDKIENFENLQLNKEILNSISSFHENNINKTLTNNFNTIFQNLSSYKIEVHNQKSNLLNNISNKTIEIFILNQPNINKKIEKSEADVLREEFLKIKKCNINNNYKNKSFYTLIKRNADNNSKIIETLKKLFIENSTNINQKEKLINSNGDPNLISYGKNYTSIKKNFLSKNTFDKFSNKKTFIEMNSFINTKNQNDKLFDNQPRLNTFLEKENKKILLLELKNLMEKYIKIKQAKGKNKKDIRVREDENLFLKKDRNQLNNIVNLKDKLKLRNYNKRNNTFDIIKLFRKEKIQNKPISDNLEKKLLQNSQEDLQMNSEKFDKKIENVKFKLSPKNFIKKNHAKIINNSGYPNINTKIPNEFLNLKFKKSMENQMKAYISLEDCNNNWDYKLNGFDWKCTVNLIFYT